MNDMDRIQELRELAKPLLSEMQGLVESNLKTRLNYDLGAAAASLVRDDVNRVKRLIEEFRNLLYGPERSKERSELL